MAGGGGDRTFARMEKARQAALVAYQADQKDQARAVTSASKKALPEKNANC
ncbi:hypothetical protein PXNS11_350140 [Stutzerimonas xanthomarina]|nr:hypothetical protein PXNS11_350140 [Stutzerimonas xanthomarina]